MNGKIILQARSPNLSFYMGPGTFLLGRSTECDLWVDQKTVSRRHAEITVKDGSVWVRDIGSSNGMFFDGKKVQVCCVQKGQSIQFGGVTFKRTAQMTSDGLIDEEEDTDKADFFDRPLEPEPSQLDLSPAQQRVFPFLLEGLSETEIAERVHLSPHTVHNHFEKIFKIFGVHNRPKLMAKVFKMTNHTFILSEEAKKDPEEKSR